jgi:hypothetical protein
MGIKRESSMALNAWAYVKTSMYLLIALGKRDKILQPSRTRESLRRERILRLMFLKVNTVLL